jgi:hypothetical protein
MNNTVKRIQEAVGVTTDGVFGPMTLAAVAQRLNVAMTLRVVQKRVGAAVDGIFGPETANKIYAALGLGWPSQADVRSGKSIYGKAGDESNLVNITPPYTLYYEGKPLKTIRVHKLVANAVREALEEVLEYYGVERIHELGLDDYSGSYNYRATASGKSLSMHAWGIALDFAANKNAYATKKPHASLSKPECDKWWEIWEAHGATSLGRSRNYDWMHLQFASL